MKPFEFQHHTRLICGAGTVERLGALAQEIGGTRVLIVSDPGVVTAGHFAKGLNSVAGAGLQVTAFHDLHPNPTTDDVNSAVSLAKEFRPDLIVGLGGGSSMDCAKGLNFVYSCGGQMRDYWGVGKATGNLLPMIAVPTTAGTGSEAQSFALISDSQTHVKMACGDKRALPAIAILDPELTVTQPRQLSALTGIDAMTHALEAYVTKSRNPMSMTFARQAWNLLSSSFLNILQNPHDVALRSQMQLGAYLSGMAIESSMLGAAHALANPLTARFSVPHGQAVGLMMPHIIRANAEDELTVTLYTDLANTVGYNSECDTTPEEYLADWFSNALVTAGMRASLSELPIPDHSLKQLATDAMPQWTLQHNPRLFNNDEVLRLYENAY
jgi:alcohol dehydrogenase